MAKKPLEKIIKEVKEFKEDAQETMKQVEEVIDNIQELEAMKDNFIDKVKLGEVVTLFTDREKMLVQMLGKIEGSHIEKGTIKAIINGLIS